MNLGQGMLYACPQAGAGANDRHHRFRRPGQTDCPLRYRAAGQFSFHRGEAGDDRQDNRAIGILSSSVFRCERPENAAVLECGGLTPLCGLWPLLKASSRRTPKKGSAPKNGRGEFCNAPITADVELTASGSDVNASVQEACEETSRPKFCNTHASALHKSVCANVVSWQFLAVNHRPTDTRSGGGVCSLSMEKPIVEHPAFEWSRFDLTAFDANAKLFMTYGRGSRRSKTPQPRRRATMPECRESRVKGPEPDGKIVARQSCRGSVPRGRCELVKEPQN